jgi:hypothetical protein
MELTVKKEAFYLESMLNMAEMLVAYECVKFDDTTLNKFDTALVNKVQRKLLNIFIQH